MAEPTPLQRYVAVQIRMDRELASVLKDSADEAERLIKSIGPNAGIGGQVRRAQLQMMVRELRIVQAESFNGVSKTLQASLRRAASAAAQAEKAADGPLRRLLAGRRNEFDRAFANQALNNVPTLQARAFNGISLSQQVYKTENLANGVVERAINRGILIGKDAKSIAKDVSSLIRPSVPGGVSYAANRLARTELNNAFHQTQIALRADNPWTTGMKWNLSGSHPRPDDCDKYAKSSHYRGGDPGVFQAVSVPKKPHPNCLCFMTTEVVEEEEFIASLTGGKYDRYLDKVVDKHG